MTWGGRWYLVAWDLDRERLADLPGGPDDAEVTDRTAVHSAGAARAATSRRTSRSRFKGQDQTPYRGEAILQAKASDIVHWAGRDAIVEEISPTSCRLVLSAWSWTGLAATFGMFECDLEFVGPQELKDAAAQLAARYHVAAS